ncbi:MAG: sigma-70 family RNA polymerase sigma factor [Clostridiales bacterium]|nr:sigma-70 family RNA polymerase sigma factor [Clostridiales bacterium]MDD7036020.1 sigma-70 family RNA polymerase sigma factor [Bacillota bacterium]
MRGKDMLTLYLALIDEPEDKSKFISLYEKYHRLMHYTAKAILKDDGLAEDAVQEAFIRIAKNFHKINDIDTASTKKFVVIITKNVALTILKKEDRFTAEDIADYENILHKNDTTVGEAENNELAQRILKLSEVQRNVMYLYAIYGYSYREIANLLGIKEGAARKNMQRAREVLKDGL